MSDENELFELCRDNPKRAAERLRKLEAVREAAIKGKARFARDHYPFPLEITEALAACETTGQTKKQE